MTPKPTGRGGPNRGQGAKIRGKEKRVRRSITLEPTAWAKLDAEGSKNGVSASEIVNRMALEIKTTRKNAKPKN